MATQPLPSSRSPSWGEFNMASGEKSTWLHNLCLLRVPMGRSIWLHNRHFLGVPKVERDQYGDIPPTLWVPHSPQRSIWRQFPAFPRVHIGVRNKYHDIAPTFLGFPQWEEINIATHYLLSWAPHCGGK